MKILFTGKGTSGSYQMRAVQLGAAMGATVQAKAVQGDHDIAVVVKRAPPEILPGLHLWAYDIIRAYPQPESYAWSRDRAIAWVREHIRRLNPTAMIWPTQKMREDCDIGLPGVVIPHHCRAGLKGNPDPGLVGYEGGERYLGKWRKAIDTECMRRGMRFVVNPKDYSRLETVVSFRENPGYVCTNWKSAVKYENALAIGARFIAQPEAGYLERAGLLGGTWIWEPSQIGHALDTAARSAGEPYTVERAAADLKAFLYTIA